MLFESEKKANTFIKFNSEEIEENSGYSPLRSYFCISCSGWHVSSKLTFNKVSKTEKIIEKYEKEKEKRLIQRKINQETAKLRNDELKRKYELIKYQINNLEKYEDDLDFNMAIENIKNDINEIYLTEKQRKKLILEIGLKKSNRNQ